MGLFSSDRYTRPGAGVSKDEPEKRRLIVFFELFFRKFWKLEQVNLVFLLLCVPIVALFFGVNYLLIHLLKIEQALVVNFLTFLPFSLFSIPLAGMTYVTGNFTREKHAFVWFDFFDQIKKNWKQLLIHGFVTFLAIFIGYHAIYFYFTLANTNGWFLMLPGVICLLLGLGFLFAQYYIFPMILTFEIPYKNILKNGMIFSVAAFLRNILLSGLHIIVWGSIFIMLDTPELFLFGMFLVLIGMPAFTSFTVNFCTYSVLVKYIIKPMYGSDHKPVVDEVKETDHYKPIEEKKTEYVFENGKLVKRTDDVESVFKDTL